MTIMTKKVEEKRKIIYYTDITIPTKGLFIYHELTTMDSDH